MPGSSRVQHTQAALERFADLVARHDGGERVDFERELRQPPELARELGELHASWTRLRGLLVSVRAGASELHLAEEEAGGRALQLDPRTQRLLELLARFRGSEPRYEVLGEIARGGMGMVLRVRERGVERELALKRMFSPEELTPQMRPLRAQLLRRLLDEAWVLSRLDHPGIVPLHELGIDTEGRVYFTMPLVRGRTLAEIFALARARQEGWSIPRALGLLQRVCEALSFAHSQGIVHRDLKPANVMVGRFGELQVMDWGLAASHRGERLAGAAGAEPSGSWALDGDSALTLGGDVLGTPSYMAPEQALGKSAEADPRADVYALGAMLYELLAGERPYHEFHSSKTSRALLEHVKAGPPWPIEELAPGEPPELLAICRKAMQREREQRYPDMQALADDLRAFREGRVVRALESGAWAEFSKWVGRNRRVAAAFGVGLVSLFAAGAFTIWAAARADERVRFEVDRRGPAALRARAEKLWPARAERIPELRTWLADARELLAHGDQHAAELERLRQRALALPPSDERCIDARRRLQAERSALEIERLGIQDELRQLEVRQGKLDVAGITVPQPGIAEGRSIQRERLASVEARLRVLDESRREPLVFRFAAPLDQARHDTLVQMLAELEPLRDPRPFGDSIADVEHRLEVARTLRDRSITAHSAEWAAACASIAGPELQSKYSGLQLDPQIGLVPVGRDPESGLWEFVDLETGSVPARGPDGKLVLESATGIVFVLVPGGWSCIGAVPEGKKVEGIDLLPDPEATQQEQEAKRVRLDAYFLSKYELTQGQWLRMCGKNPSYYSVGTCFSDPFPTADLAYPVERMSWKEASEVLSHFGLILPSEAQWEHAARAGTRTPFWWGAEREPALRLTNVGERVPHSDSSVRADSYDPNPWGFCCILGNLAEWTSDSYWTSYRWNFANDGTGRQLSPDSGLRSVRGGTYADGIDKLRVSFRFDSPPDQPNQKFGLRPARAIER